MTTATEVRTISPIAEIRAQLNDMGSQFQAALPRHIPVERFARVVMTAIQNNPELLQCDRRSLWNSAMKAAQDGLLPDGREGAMVVRWDGQRQCKVAGWQPMIAGIRKKVRNSGEIADWNVFAVFEKDRFTYRLGDDPFIEHEPYLDGDPGPLRAVYSIAQLRSGEKSRDVMSIAKCREIRDRYSDGWKAFQAGKIKDTPWASAEEEMCKKTLARRHSKVLPMSTDLDDLIRRDDDLYDFAGGKDQVAPPQQRPSLIQSLDRLAEGIGMEADPPLPGEATGHRLPGKPAAAPADAPSPDRGTEAKADPDKAADAPPDAVQDAPDFDPETGEVFDQSQPADDDVNQDPDAPLLRQAREAATKGGKPWKLFKGKLTKAQQLLLAPHMDDLDKVAAASPPKPLGA